MRTSLLLGVTLCGFALAATSATAVDDNLSAVGIQPWSDAALGDWSQAEGAPRSLPLSSRRVPFISSIGGVNNEWTCEFGPIGAVDARKKTPIGSFR